MKLKSNNYKDKYHSQGVITVSPENGLFHHPKFKQFSLDDACQSENKLKYAFESGEEVVIGPVVGLILQFQTPEDGTFVVVGSRKNPCLRVDAKHEFQLATGGNPFTLSTDDPLSLPLNELLIAMFHHKTFDFFLKR